MSFAKKISFVTLMFLVGCFTASAQDHVIKFTLPQAASIGSAALPAGPYRMVVYDDPQLMVVVMPEDQKGESVIAIPASFQTIGNCASPSVTLKRVEDRMEISSVCFGYSEMALRFATDHRKKPAVVSQATATAALAGAQ